MSELEELVLSIRSSVNHLFGLSILIRRQRPKGRLPTLSSFSHLESSPDIVNVTDKFPKVKQNRWLAQRLGNAITQRRHSIQYRQTHREHLTASRGSEKNVLSDDTAITIATTFEEAPEGNLDLLTESSRDQQSIFTSATSLASNYDDDHSMGRHVPDLSDMVLDGVQLEYGEAFECPYCRTIQKVMNRFEWKYVSLSTCIKATRIPPPDYSHKLTEDMYFLIFSHMSVHTKTVPWACSLLAPSGLSMKQAYTGGNGIATVATAPRLFLPVRRI